MSSNPLNDLSKTYLDQVANVKKAETQADIQRWEDLGGPTPGNYKPLDDSAKLKESRKTKKQVISDWRNDIFEAGDPDAVQTPGYKTSKDSAKKVTEKSVKNTVIINPKLNEAIKEIGGEVIVAEEVEEIDEDDQTRHQQLQRKQLMIDRQKLQLRRRALGKKKKENNDGGSETDAQANVIANEGVMTMLGRKKKEKKAEKAMDAGARAKRMLARKIHAKYVSGSEENVPDDIAEGVFKGPDEIKAANRKWLDRRQKKIEQKHKEGKPVKPMQDYGEEVVHNKKIMSLGEEGYDRMRDDRLVKYGIGHDGSDRKGPSPRPTGKQPKGDTVYQKEMKKKYGGKLPSAVQVVTDKIKEKYGKGAIHNAK